jgi:hypothetical protein
MWWFIKHPILGYFVGENCGLAFFEHHVKDGADVKPYAFKSEEEAEKYMGNWDYGASGCFITEEIPACYIDGEAA